MSAESRMPSPSISVPNPPPVRISPPKRRNFPKCWSGPPARPSAYYCCEHSPPGSSSFVKIVSLFPAATDIVRALGGGGDLVGISHECVVPDGEGSCARVTQSLMPHDLSSKEIDGAVSRSVESGESLYRLDREALAKLAPDVILVQATCGVCAVSELDLIEVAGTFATMPKIVLIEPTTMEQVFHAIRTVGEAIGREAEGDALVKSLRQRVEAVRARTLRIAERPRLLILEWIDPLFSAGHWNAELVTFAGAVEGIARPGISSRRILWGEVYSWQPEILVLACCGQTPEAAIADLPKVSANPGFYEMPCVRAGRIYVADGQRYFTMPSPQLVDALEMLAHAVHPTRHPLPAGLEPLRRVSVAGSLALGTPTA